jgi:hypothetical protein
VVRFHDVVKQDTPRLVVQFSRPAPGKEGFQWGIVGQFPVLSMVGYLSYVQRAVVEDDGFDRECPESALVIAWDAATNRFDYFVHPDIPEYSLAGMLEVIKAALVDSQLVQHVRNQQVGLVDGTGRPVRKVVEG